MNNIISQEITFLWRALLSLCFSHTCVICKATLEIYEDHICPICKAAFEFLPTDICRCCAHPLPTDTNIIMPCPNCRDIILYHKRTVGLFILTPVLKDLFHHIKYYRKQWLLKLFSPYIRGKAVGLLADVKFDFIIPIPLSKIRMFQRGFNQALIIANMLRFTTGKPVLTNIVQRRCGAVQSRLRRNQRLTNQRGTFIIRRADRIQNKAILIVDDIYTTGSTVNECARVLKEHGAGSVNVFTIARTI